MRWASVKTQWYFFVHFCPVLEAKVPTCRRVWENSWEGSKTFLPQKYKFSLSLNAELVFFYIVIEKYKPIEKELKLKANRGKRKRFS